MPSHHRLKRPSPAAPVLGVLLLALATGVARAQDDDDSEGVRPVTEVIVTARRLDTARSDIEPALGASVYSLTNDTIEARPGGETTSLGQLLLQAPGVTRGAEGRIAVRGSDGPLQYRINNVIVPDGFADLGDSLSARLADRVDLVTGALPAQYGLQTGGVVNITTKTGTYFEGGQAELYGGGPGEIEPAFEYAGDALGVNFFVSGSALRSDRGLAPPTPGRAHHDRTDQLEGFGYFERIIDERSRVSLVLAASDERFQVPNAVGLDAANLPSGAFQRPLTVNGIIHFSSAALDAGQRQTGRIAILAYQRTGERGTLQVAAFGRASRFRLRDDRTGDLLFTGLAQTTDDRDQALGFQIEGLWWLSANHDLRGGMVLSEDRLRSAATSFVLPLDALGRQIGDTPQAIRTVGSRRDRVGSLFLQDEWRIAPTLTLNYGLRFDRTDDADQVSPRVNLVWTLSPSLILHGGYARNLIPAQDDLRTATALALVGTTGAPPGTAGDPLRPERDDLFDLGFQYKTGGLTLGIDGYRRSAQDLLTQTRLRSLRPGTVFNLREGRFEGVEVSLILQRGPLSGWLNLAASRARGRGIVSRQFAFTPSQRAAADSEFPLDQDQALTGSAGAAWRRGPWQVSGDLTYGTGAPRTTAGGRLNGARLAENLQVNLSMVYHTDGLGDRPLDLRLDLENALDRRNPLSDGTGLAAGDSAWDQGRGLFVGFEQAF